MRRKRRIMPLLAFCGMMILILDGKTAILGIQGGIDLCLKTMIPSLFPFLVFSSLLLEQFNGQPVGQFWPFRGMHSGVGPLMLTGLIGGYPIGARNVADTVSNGRISEADAQKLVILCNNAGPAFMFGVLGPMFPSLKWPLVLWITQIFAAILTGKVLKCNFQVAPSEPYRKESNFVTIVQSSLRTMANICGWIVIFRMILEFLNRWVLWLLPQHLRILLTGLIELSNGCILLTEMDNVQHRLLFASIMTTFGGFCVLMQTKSVFPPLSLKEYLLGKMLQCGISVILLIVSLPLLDGFVNLARNLTAVLLISMMILGMLITRNRKKEVAIP